MNTTTTATSPVRRGTFGEITNPEIVQAGMAVVARAVELKLLEEESFVRHSSKSGESLSYDIYDRKGGTWLVQQRHTTWNKYGSSPAKEYFLLRRAGRGIIIEAIAQGKKGTANRAAKLAVKLGDAIRTLRGELKLPGVKRGPSGPTTCYKAVALVEGQMRSIFDANTVYVLGTTLVQKAQGDHGGGYYVYRTAAEARHADVPRSSDNLHAPRIVIECECGGRSVHYDSGKIAYTRLKPVAIVAD